MNIIFADKKIKKWGNDFKLAKKKLGNERAKKLHQRLSDMVDTESFAGLRYLPGKYHALTGDRKGQWSCDLDQPYRLIFEPADNPVPYNEHGTPILIEMRIVEIIEIEDYH